MSNERVCQLNIVEPWEFGTEKPIDVKIIDRNENNYLLILSQPRLFKEKKIQYLIAELRNKNLSVDLFSIEQKGVFPINMVFSTDVDLKSFRNYRIPDFRADFLVGDIILS